MDFIFQLHHQPSFGVSPSTLLRPPPPSNPTSLCRRRHHPIRRRRDSMDRLLYSPSPTSLKINPNSSLILSRFRRIDSVKLNFPLPTRRGLKPFGFISCKNEKPSMSLIRCLSSSTDSISLSGSQAGSPKKSDFLEQLVGNEKVLIWNSSFFSFFLSDVNFLFCFVILR